MTSFIREITPPIFARRGLILKVIGVARISTVHQDALSLADQEASYRRWLDEHFAGQYELEMISTRRSGERVDRDD